MVACQLLLYGVTGTLTHMPPEVLEHGVTSKAADVYSFGVLLWQVGAGGLQDTAWGVAGHCLAVGVGWQRFVSADMTRLHWLCSVPAMRTLVWRQARKGPAV